MMMSQITLISHVPMTQKLVALTFDDGPDPLYTPILLKLFEQYNVKATFFTVGQQIEAHREIAVATHEAGHELGNHTYSHPFLTQLSHDQQLSEFTRTEQLLVEITGKKPATFRPPYFDMNDDIIALSESFHYRTIMAMNGEAKDWEQPGVDYILDKTREHVVPGSILLFHDGFGDRSQTMEAVRILLEEYTPQGYKFVTVSELLQLR
jgi:peptidoglycan/xylan/chitin deacetylase (PgdA/CDA1 family)